MLERVVFDLVSSHERNVAVTVVFVLMYNYILELECVEIHATGDCLCFGCFMLQIVMKKIRSRSKE